METRSTPLIPRPPIDYFFELPFKVNRIDYCGNDRDTKMTPKLCMDVVPKMLERSADDLWENMLKHRPTWLPLWVIRLSPSLLMSFYAIDMHVDLTLGATHSLSLYTYMFCSHYAGGFNSCYRVTNHISRRIRKIW